MNAKDTAAHLRSRHGECVHDGSAAAVRTQHERAHTPGGGANHTHTATPHLPVRRCEAYAKRGTGTGSCGRPIVGNAETCDRAGDHITA